jgi:hypothetical protein
METRQRVVKNPGGAVTLAPIRASQILRAFKSTIGIGNPDIVQRNDAVIVTVGCAHGFNILNKDKPTDWLYQWKYSEDN